MRTLLRELRLPVEEVAPDRAAPETEARVVAERFAPLLLNPVSPRLALAQVREIVRERVVPMVERGCPESRSPGLSSASSLFNRSQQVGGALGLAILSTLAVNRIENHLGGLPGQPTAVSRARRS